MTEPSSVPRTIIVGAGFGGLACATELGRAGVSVTIIDARTIIFSYHSYIRSRPQPCHPPTSPAPFGAYGALIRPSMLYSGALLTPIRHSGPSSRTAL